MLQLELLEKWINMWDASEKNFLHQGAHFPTTACLFWISRDLLREEKGTNHSEALVNGWHTIYSYSGQWRSSRDGWHAITFWKSKNDSLPKCNDLYLRVGSSWCASGNNLSCLLNIFTLVELIFVVFWKCSRLCLLSKEMFLQSAREQFYRRRSANDYILGV